MNLRPPPLSPHGLDSQEEDNDWKGTLLDRSTQPRRRPVSSREPEPKNRLWIAMALFAVAVLAIVGIVMVKGNGAGGDAPLIQADATPYKTRPDQPGGAEIPFQDKLVFNRLDPNGQPVQAEKLLPPPEEPMANGQNKPMTTKQVTAPPDVASGNVPTAAPTPIVVRQAEPQQVATTEAKPTTVTTEAKPTTVTTEAKPTTITTTTSTTIEPTVAAKQASTVAKPAPVLAAAPVAAAKPAPLAPPVVAAKPVPVASAPAPVNGGQVRIQLASIPEAGNAQKALADLSAKYRSSLGGTSLGIVKADLGAKGVFYRIQSGGMSREAADRACAGIKAQGGACITAK